MSKVKKRIAFCLLGACLCLLFAAGLLLLPFSGVKANADAAAGSLNDNLVVRYDMGRIEGGKIKASVWNAGKYEDNSSYDAAIKKLRNGANEVESGAGTTYAEDGFDGNGAVRFAKNSFAEAGVHLDSAATGMTVSFWGKNINNYWGDVVEFYNGSEGGRFGKGTIQRNGGHVSTWNSNGRAHGSGAIISADGGWDAFVVGVNSGDSGTSTGKGMKADTWYQVTITVTETHLKMYRDGVLMVTFEEGKNENSQRGDNLYGLVSILTSAKSTSGKIGIHSGDCNDRSETDILDDLRIYNDAMTDADVRALCNEYRAVSSISPKTLKTDDPVHGETELPLIGVANGENVTISVSDGAPFPKLLLGGASAEDVTESAGTYSYTGTDFSYSYTVSGMIATVTYVAHNTSFTFTVAPPVIRDLRISVDGGTATSVEGFSAGKTDYEVNLSPEVNSVRFEVLQGAGTFDLTGVNGNINYNGDNRIDVAIGDKTITYTVKLVRPSANVAPSIVVKGERVQLIKGTQTVYVNALPESAFDVFVDPVYPRGSEVSSVSKESDGTYRFTVTDRAVPTDSTQYILTFKNKQESYIAYWDCNDNSGATIAGKKWDPATKAFVPDSALDMKVHQNGNDVAATDSVKAADAASVSGYYENALKLPAWGYTSVTLPAVQTNAFTFSAWAKLSNNGGAGMWEAIFSLYDRDYTKGVIFEKGNMQKALFAGGNVTTGWQNINVEGGAYESALKWTHFNSDELQLLTVTVSYVDGVGVVRYYVNGSLVVSYVNHSAGSAGGANQMAKNAIEALQSGAHFGLHRHCYDSGYESVFDEVQLYAFEMTQKEVYDLYRASQELAMFENEPYEVEGADYPDLMLGGATSVGGTTVKTGVTADGVMYTYAPVSGTANKTQDDEGVEVTLIKGLAHKTINITYRRTLPVLQATVNYTAGSAGSVGLNDPDRTTVVKVPGNVAIGSITGSVTVTPYAGTDASDYTSSFEYDSATGLAKVTLQYKDYDPVVYAVRFKHMGSDASLISVTVGKQTISASAFDADNNARVSVENVASFTLTISVKVPDGATVKGGTKDGEHIYNVTRTQADLVGGKVSFVVIAEDETEATYTLTPAIPSGVAALSALSFEGLSMTPAFESGVYEYGVSVTKGTDAGEILKAIRYTPAEWGSVAIRVESGTIKIIVTSENGENERIYTVAVTETEDTRSADATLSGILFDGVKIAGFNAGRVAYTVSYTGELSSALAKLTYTVNSEKAQAEKTVSGDTVSVKVTAENGTEKTYTVKFVVTAGSEIAGGTDTEDNYKVPEGCASSVGSTVLPVAVALTGVAIVCIVRKRRAK